jgi:hypothetical protein
MVREKAQRLATSQKLRHVGLAVAAYQQATGHALVAENLGDWLVKLAAETGLRESSLLLFDEDPLLASVGELPPPVLVHADAQGRWQTIDQFSKWPLGITVASGIHALANPSTTPVAWTRGLQRNGKWRAFGAADSGIYGDSGGFIVFLDGHVEFHRDLGKDGGRLIRYGDGIPTADIMEALPPGAKAFNYRGAVLQ